MMKKFLCFLLVFSIFLPGISCADQSKRETESADITESYVSFDEEMAIESDITSESEVDTESFEENDSLLEQNVPSGFLQGALPLYYTNKDRTIMYEYKKNFDFSEKTPPECARILVHDMLDWENTILVDERAAWISVCPSGVYRWIEYTAPQLPQTKGVITIFVADEYKDLPRNQQVMFQVGMSKALLSLNMFRAIEFVYVNDENRAVFFQAKENQSFIINDTDEEAFSGVETITLFFPNSEGTFLEREEREITLGLSDSIVRAVLDALMAGPQSSGLVKAIPEGSVIKDVFVKNQVCYIDFSSEFRTNYVGTDAGEKLLLYSIVNSVCQLQGIKQVQFLINGKRVEIYKHSENIYNYLSKDLSLVQ